MGNISLALSLRRDAYAYDNVGNRTKMTVTDNSGSSVYLYTYGSIYQMTGVDYPAGFDPELATDTTFDYDAAGNRETVEDDSGVCTYTVNKLNQYETAGPVNFEYDPNGNMTYDGTNRYTHDLENRLIRVQKADTLQELSSYVYDAAGRRVERKCNGVTLVKYVYDGDRCIAEYNGSGQLLRQYIYGPGVDEPICMVEKTGSYTGTYYYHFDGLGSVVALTDEDGLGVQFYDYSVYGQVSASNPAHPNRFMFTGREYDKETGLYYYRARYYNPQIGRFLQTDPVGYQAGMNLYAYCGNNSLNWADPYGLEKVQVRGLNLKYDSSGNIILEWHDLGSVDIDVNDVNTIPTFGGYDCVIFGDWTKIERDFGNLWALPTGQDLLKSFSGKSFGINIIPVQGTSKREKNRFTSRYYFTKTQTTIVYDPECYSLGSNPDTDPSWMYRPPAIGLGHELIHAYWNLAQGMDVRTGTTSAAEQAYWEQVVIYGMQTSTGSNPFPTENKLRQEWHDRMPYSAGGWTGLPVQRPPPGTP
jgi:RHS repeat-associated protein